MRTFVIFGGIAMLAVVLCLSGCGGASPSAPNNSGSVGTMGKIVEYVGDGLSTPKPLPPELGGTASGQMQTQRLGDLLALNKASIAQTVPVQLTNWFRISPIANPVTLIVTLQPMADEDTDLYVMAGHVYTPNLSDIAYSDRVPTETDNVTGIGYAPDWVSISVSPTSGYPTANVAVFGYDSGASPKHFRIEADRVFSLPVNSGSHSGYLPRYSCHWMSFNGVSGTNYSVNEQSSRGDADIYVYYNTSSGFVASNTQSGTEVHSATFTAPYTGTYYVRVYGYALSSHYTVWVTSP